MDGQTIERKSPCVVQDFVPFEAPALLPPILIHNHAKQGNGYRCLHAALGRLISCEKGINKAVYTATEVACGWAGQGR